ncbi:hypothetical protein ACFPYI_14415 [Halomarina salina]|uniref:DUF4625 domain-containing protein n=1 Tax=Halomarina salina TaxID=1872699 RepID=A0ABD5RPQ8_9EURY|nr:hypothetical protein [Halomarina salina]
MRTLHALLVCCCLLAGCVSGVGSPETAPVAETANGSVYTADSGGSVSASASFEAVRELRVAPANVSAWPGDHDAVTVESSSFSPRQSAQVDTLPPYHLWDAPTDVDATFRFDISESAAPGDYRFTVTAWDDGNHSHESGTTETVVIRVTEDESPREMGATATVR